MGFRYVASGPMVRSSYKAGELFLAAMMDEDDALNEAEHVQEEQRTNMAYEVRSRAQSPTARPQPAWNPELEKMVAQ